MGQTRYDKQRDRITPPHVPLGVLRAASRMTLDEVCERVNEYLQPKTDREAFKRGSLSAVENGHRRPSARVLAGLEFAYGLRPGDIVTDYAPREWKDAS